MRGKQKQLVGKTGGETEPHRGKKMNGGRKDREREEVREAGVERGSGRYLRNTETQSDFTNKMKKTYSRLTSDCSLPALTVGRRQESKEEGEGGERRLLDSPPVRF